METMLAVFAGLPLTLLVTLTALSIGTVLAIPLLFGLRSTNGPLRFFSRCFVDVFRGIPPVVWLFVLFFGVTMGATRLSAFAAGVIGLGLVASGYLAEIFRGSLKAIQTGQWEAAHALGFSEASTWSQVIGPQLWRTALPGFTTYAIALFKDSSIVSMLGVAEMVFTTSQLARSSELGIFVYAVAAAVYIGISLPLGVLSRSLDVRLRRAVAK
ncbi:amino acid ABC transporter permease [Pseudarthrobacter sp. NPDC057230]|uniref:amino acid ABC transporter permease n=1 Tax=Pseudarthrobacter sp. NPDC057230 TaxID=3346057 RepID=UPI00362B9B6B